MLSLLKNLTYGHKLQMAEGNAAIALPLERSDLETWVTKSEERNAHLSKKLKPKHEKPEVKSEAKGDVLMGEKTAPNQTGECHESKGYLCVEPPRIPTSTSLFYFDSCCCDDWIMNALEVLYQFALQRKTLNPAILRVTKRYSNNQACNALEVDFNLLGLSAQTEQDIKDLLLKYITLLGY